MESDEIERQELRKNALNATDLVITRQIVLHVEAERTRKEKSDVMHAIKLGTSL